MSAGTVSSLSQFRMLGRSGLRVSPLCLGAMTFGTEWGWGVDLDESRRVLDLYADRGGNFIDTANIYTHGTSETFLGELLQGRRERFVLATKYTFTTRRGDPNASGNQRKNLVQSLEASLRRLKCEYVDLYWVHAWDGVTPIDELMRALDDVVRAGKVLYVGASDFPAWKVAQANTLAELQGWTRFVGLQIEYSLVQRDAERDLVPMALELGLGVTPWSPLAMGLLTGKYSPADVGGGKAEPDGTRRHFVAERMTERTTRIVNELRRVAGELGRSLAQVALRWLMQKRGVTSIILGARTVQQLADNLGCLDFTLSAEHMQRLDEASKIDLGFPHAFLASDLVRDGLLGGSQLAS